MEENGRREFLKRLGIGGAVVAGSFGLIQVSAPKHERGEHKGGATVVKGNSRKEEVLYQKTANWDKFYKSAL
jgi:hypothetical protein